MVDSPFNEDPKNIIFFQGRPNFGEGRPENLGKMGNNRDICCYANQEVVNFKRAYQPLPLVPKPLWCLNFPTCLTKFLEKNEKGPKFDLSLGSFPPKI